MARDNTGTFSLPNPPAQPGTPANPAPLNANIEEMRAALTDSLSRNGFGGMLTDLAMGGRKITGLAIGTATTDAVTLAQLNGITAPVTAALASEVSTRAAADTALSAQVVAGVQAANDFATASVAAQLPRDGSRKVTADLDLVGFALKNTGSVTAGAAAVVANDGTNTAHGVTSYAMGAGIPVLHVSARFAADQGSVGVMRRSDVASNTVSGSMLQFYAGTQYCGQVAVQFGNSIAYQTSSDYRLKQDVVTLPDAMSKFDRLDARTFAFRNDPTRRVSGFVAHEVQAVVPEAVSGSKDAVNDKGEPVYQGVDLSRLVPLLWAVVKEQAKRIDALERK